MLLPNNLIQCEPLVFEVERRSAFAEYYSQKEEQLPRPK